MIVKGYHKEIPEHLLPFIATQDASLYTPIDHASWRYILLLSRDFFSKYAHQIYLDGLEETGINIERIPLISEMDLKLKDFGWGAIPVVGFIPPMVFLEFLSLGILPIAADMRTLEHLSYTPAPDIVHEAAGHAPIVADPAYAEYLKNYGELARKVIFSDKDMEVYDAIRDLSDTKEDPKSTAKDIEKAQKKLDEATASVTYVSEATQLSRMGWWTFEYGLVGSMQNPKIYGAGLLSSVSESFHCIKPKVKKIPMSIDCIEYSYDITKPQPQLFVAKDFPSLSKILDEFSNRMAFRKGGVEGLEKAQAAKTVNTVQLDTGLQISGKLTEFFKEDNQPIFLRFQGPTQLAYNDEEIKNQGPKYHNEGFSTPVGPLKNIKKKLSQLKHTEVPDTLEFQSGIKLQGKCFETISEGKKTLVLRFKDCTITYKKQTLFKPEWGVFDLACGETIPSVFGGAADRAKYLHATGGYQQRPNKPKTNLTAENKELNELYAIVRKQRESKKPDTKKLETIFNTLEKNYRQDWLLRFEILELDKKFKLSLPFKSKLLDGLKKISAKNQDQAELISRGLALL